MVNNTEDPGNVLDYSWDWSLWLASGDTIQTSTWTVPIGITQTTPNPSISGNVTTIWLTGGTVGQTYTVTNKVVTSQGRTKYWSRTIYIETQ
jgi:hypothetical protein